MDALGAQLSALREHSDQQLAGLRQEQEQLEGTLPPPPPHTHSTASHNTTQGTTNQGGHSHFATNKEPLAMHSISSCVCVRVCACVHRSRSFLFKVSHQMWTYN